MKPHILIFDTPRSKSGELFVDKCGTFVGEIGEEEFESRFVIGSPWFKELESNEFRLSEMEKEIFLLKKEVVDLRYNANKYNKINK